MTGAAPARRVLFGAIGVAVAGLLWLTFSQTFQIPWNAPRLAAPAALVRGLAIYGTPEAGPFLGWIYGPVFPLVFSVVAWIPDVVGLMAAAWALNLLLPLGAAWACVRTAAGPVAAVRAVGVTTLFALATEYGRSALYFIHVDLLGCTLGAVACVLLVRSGGRWKLAGGAVAAALAVGTKQVALALPLGLVAALVAEGRREEAGRFLLGFALAGAGLAAVSVGLAGWKPLWFNLWTYHRYNPLPPDFAGPLLGKLFALVLEAGPALILALALRPPAEKGQPSPAAALERRLLWVALAHLPLGLLAAAKVAGGLNSVHTFYYLGFWLAVRVARGLPPAGLPAGRRGVAVAALVLAAGVAVGGLATRPLPWRPDFRALQHDEILAHERAGRVYFPWNPLVTVLAEGRVPPFDDALLCLDRSGLPAAPAAVRAGIPSGALVIYPEPAQSMFALNFLRSDPP